jgi:hypothetical protein
VFAATLVTALVLAVPHGWHTIKSNPKLHGSCDPVTLGYMVFAGPGTTVATQRATERMLDSLRVS